jgi:hypothetical protein
MGDKYYLLMSTYMKVRLIKRRIPPPLTFGCSLRNLNLNLCVVDRA